MSKKGHLPPQVKYWLSPDTKHDCYFNVGSKSGPTKRIGAFKAFLIGYSEPLRAMLQDSKLAEQGDINIVDIQPDTFRYFLKCLYMGMHIKNIRYLSFKKCCDLLYVAEKYLVIELKAKLIKQCLNSLSSKISCINVACSSKVFMQENCLEVALSKIVQCQTKSIVSSEQFLDITDGGLLWILELDPLDIDEIALWQAVLKWAKNKTNSNDGNVIRKCILMLLKCIRFCSMNVQDFCEHVVPTNILTDKEVIQICKYYGTKEMPNMEFICNVVTHRHHTDGFKPERTFSYIVTDILSLTDCRRSKSFEFQNFNWHILIKKKDDVLGLFLVCEGLSYDPSWKCCAKGTLTLVNHEESNRSLSFCHHTFNNKETDWGYNKFILWREIVDPSKNFVLNGSITVSVTVSA